MHGIQKKAADESDFDMSFLGLILLAVGLSMDAFAVAVCNGLAMKKPLIKKAVAIGLYFGAFQALMPLIGYFAATLFAERIIAYDHWIAFALLSFLGGKMVYGSRKKPTCHDRKCTAEKCSDRMCPVAVKPDKDEPQINISRMLPLALATSIDALAVGVSFAFLRVNIASAAMLIGITTFLISASGVKIGNVFGSKFKPKAEMIGGIILILIGFKVLFDHLGII